MKLWLDDDRDPQDPNIQEEFGSTADMVWVKSVPVAIELLNTGEVSGISLDYHLGGSETGFHLACWIRDRARLGQLPPLQWRTHTQNAGADLDMTRALKNANRYWSEKGEE